MAQSHSSMKTQLPENATLFRAQRAKKEFKVLLVPNYGGNRESLKRHILMINEHGFDVVAMDLKYNDTKLSPYIPLSRDLKLGLRHVWAEQIELVLNAIDSPIVLYSFDLPSASALQAIDRQEGNNILGWITDGGPFLDLAFCLWKDFS